MTQPLTLAQAQTAVAALVERFGRNLEQYRRPEYNEANVRHEFIEPFFEASRRWAGTCTTAPATPKPSRTSSSRTRCAWPRASKRPTMPFARAASAYRTHCSHLLQQS